MNQHAAVSNFSHVKPADTEFKGGGLRDFFLYRDLGIAAATGGQGICHLVKAHADMRQKDGTGWHRHDCDFQIVIMRKGWARFMYEDKPTLVQAGDVVHQRPGITHYLFDYSPDMEYLEVVSPADFKTLDVEGPCAVPPPTPWTKSARSALDFQFFDLLRLQLGGSDPIEQVGPGPDVRAIGLADRVQWNA